MSFMQENAALKSYNTFGIAASARYFADILTEEDLVTLLHSDLIATQRLLVLGGGSNILFTQDFDGLVIRMNIQGISEQIDGDTVLLKAGAGVVWNDLVSYCVKKGYAGIENLSLIPGTVGASPVQNIGAYGVELKDVFVCCEAYELATTALRVFSFADCSFGYRDSIFKRELKGRYIITSVTFRLSKKASVNTQYGAIQEELRLRKINEPSIADVAAVVSQIRVSKLPDPSTIGNAGSFFKNPVISKQEFDQLFLNHPDVVNYPVAGDMVKLAAGWLIEACGFKGLISGQTGTWKNQALVIVNHGHATGQEVYSFSEQIIEAVDAKFGVKLEREVNIL